MSYVPQIDLDRDTHTYHVDGEVWPSVTQALSIVGDFSQVHPDVLEAARQLGSHVHAAIDLDCRNVLDEDALDPELRPYLNGWRRFVAESGARIVSSEFRVWHPLMKYVGTADVAVDWRGSALIDVKTGVVPRTAGAQLVAYARGNNAINFKPRRLFCLQLSPDSYKVVPQSNPSDWALFTSCLNIWRFKNAG